MNVKHIITEALIEYDSVKPVIRYLVKKTGRIEGVRSESDVKRTTLKFIHRDTNEVILDTEVETLAIYYNKLHVWSWAWSQVGLTNAENYLSKKILSYALDLGTDLSYLKTILTTSRGVLKDQTQIDINLAIGASIVKQPYIFPFDYSIGDHKLIYYIILLNKEALADLKSKIETS